MTMDKKIKILIVDDSALIRQTLTKVLTSYDEFEVTGVAADPYIAAHKMKVQKPDVITLDIQMPKMDGLTFLKKLMSQHPIPVIVISSLTTKESDIALSAYKLGAIDVIEKPVMSTDFLYSEWKEKIYNSIKTAAESSVNQRKTKGTGSTIKNPIIEKKLRLKETVSNSIILIGSSAGGTEVINNILSNLSETIAPILIVQHMPVLFTASYAERLNQNSNLHIKEASIGDELYRGTVLLAPGDKHMELKNNGFNFFVDLNLNDKINRHRPSVDVLFKSALKFGGINILAIILSGMGKDGAEGMLELKKAGAKTVAQDKDSCIVYGMPKEALETGAADFSLSIEEIIIAIDNFSRKYK